MGEQRWQRLVFAQRFYRCLVFEQFFQRYLLHTHCASWRYVRETLEVPIGYLAMLPTSLCIAVNVVNVAKCSSNVAIIGEIVTLE